MLGQPAYVKQIFIGVIEERCWAFLIKKTMPLLPTLGQYKTAAQLLTSLKKEGCDWYKEFIEEMSSSKLSESDFSYTDVDMKSFYRFAAVVVKRVNDNKFDYIWKDGTLETKISKDKSKKNVIGNTKAYDTYGDFDLQEIFISILDIFLYRTFSDDVKTSDTWCGYYKKDPKSIIFDLDYYYSPAVWKVKPNPNPCCDPKIEAWDNPVTRGYIIPASYLLGGKVGYDKNPTHPIENKLAAIYNALDTHGAGSTKLGEIYVAYKSLTPAERCWICKRKPYLSPDQGPSLLRYVDNDIDDPDEDEQLAVLTRLYLNCEEFGKPTFVEYGGLGDTLVKYNNLASNENDIKQGIDDVKGDSQWPSGKTKVQFSGATIKTGTPATGQWQKKCTTTLIKVSVDKSSPDRAAYHYEVYTRILDLILYQTIKAYLV